MLAGTTTLLVILSLWAAGTTTAAGPGWSIQPTPNPPFSDSNGLSSVSCSDAADCAAFGSGNAMGFPGVFAEVLSGGGWTNQPIGGFNSNGVDAFGIDCPGANVCYAVGDAAYVVPGITSPSPLLLRFDGSNWNTLNVPGIGNKWASLHGISCGSETDCLAVGEVKGKPLVESLSGTKWHRVAAPQVRHALLYAVSCTDLDQCMVVGSVKQSPRLGVAELWNGQSWKRERTPKLAHGHRGVLADVSCTAPDACVAVGAYRGSAGSQPLAERWNGRRWSLLSTASDAQGPSPDVGNYFSSVSCAAANACEAVGYDLPHNDALAEAWDGTSWTWQTLPGGRYSLSGVSCVSAVQCEAVGSGPGGTLALEYSVTMPVA
jgi:hypothetical protein